MQSQNVWLDKQQERCNAVVVAAECGISDGLTSGGSWQCFFVLWETKGRLTNGASNPENEKNI